ncbi:MAG: tRNA 2-thiouridine(34) synthase MnmA [bacterium]|nr:tRNA 2-thiouridine(34) synthase MnmA [bacterium]
MMKKRVVVAMSGGVDSNVAAYLLLKSGYEVIGITMDLFRSSCQIDNPRTCCSLQAFEDARDAAERLGISHFIFDLKEEFEKEVVNYFLEEYLHGRTPNPCIRCNERIKFGTLLKKAKELKADYVATGHYARVEYDEENGHYLLKKGVDSRKDQSYVLFSLRQEQLKYILFPLGEFTKTDVRKIAQDLGLKVYDKPESQEICFIHDNDYRRFLKGRGVQEKHGPIMDNQDKVLGEHHGIQNYTIGQRKGLGIVHGKPLYTIKIDRDRNAVIVGDKEDLFQNELIASHVNWIAWEPSNEPITAKAKIRYSHKESPAKIFPLSHGKAKVRFDSPQPSITPGQAVVFYQDDLVLGGGWIEQGRRLSEIGCAIF